MQRSVDVLVQLQCNTTTDRPSKEHRVVSRIRLGILLAAAGLMLAAGPALVLEYRQLAKLRSTYLDSLPSLVDGEGRVHTTFNQVGTATGRLSSTNPNLQNIPVRTALGREIRAAFIPAPGNLLMSA